MRVLWLLFMFIAASNAFICRGIRSTSFTTHLFLWRFRIVFREH